ncbi:PAS domain-containing protein [Aestuariispira ectoiniformans]|uniref:PAS domain-containing protein n=1 Tax=Aestuariispira ectoiniformans TaxID=2775080 RepID=UPI00223AD632|nr:PAS domain-containing protein [Aestuariispira ectoiniformans]
MPKNLPSRLHPTLTRFRDIWAGLKGNRELPGPEDFSLDKFADFLPNICWIDVENSGADTRRYRYQFVGQALSEVIGADVSGRYLDEIFGEDAYDWLQREYEDAIANKSPSYHSFLRNTVDNALIFYERLLLPFGREGEEACGFLALHLTTIKGAASFTDIDCPLPVRLT